MKDDSTINMRKQDGLNVGYPAYNTAMAPFNNPKMGRALNMTIDNSQSSTLCSRVSAGRPRTRSGL